MVLQNADRVLVWAIVLISTIGIASCANVATADCAASNGAECKGIPNANCTGTSGSETCKCVQGFESTTDATKCTAIALRGDCKEVADCKNVAHSKCDTTCQCADGYKEKNGLCQLLVTGTNCTKKDDPCTGIANSVCGGTKCSCGTGYLENYSTCDAIFGSHCTGSAACTELADSLCADNKCGCAASFVEKNNLCVKAVSSKTCSKGGTECNSIKNSECDETKLICKCNDGFVENGDTCDTKSGTVSVTSAVGLLFGSLLILLIAP